MMAILNYTTSVPAEKSIGQITSLLVRKQARSITTEFDDAGQVTAITFVMAVAGMPVRFQLPSNSEGVARVMLKDAPYNSRRRGNRSAYEDLIRGQAVNVSWRILKDWVEAQMALIESGQAEAAQVFMPYATQTDGRTMYELFVESHQKQLGSGE